MADPELDPNASPGLHLVSAFLAMEPADSLLSLARACGGGRLVTENLQRFIWDHCIRDSDGKVHPPYLKNFIKKLICEVESDGGDVLDELYEQCGHYMTNLKDSSSVKGSAKVCKCISFLFPDGCSELQACAQSKKLVVPLHCSLNMLEGDTGCTIWPSSLYLSELILSFPDMFSNKSCFEVGSGTGLVGICLCHVEASKLVLTDGDLSTLANMKLNLELNQLSTVTKGSEKSSRGQNAQDIKFWDHSPCKSEVSIKPLAPSDYKGIVLYTNLIEVTCTYLPWESATESELQEFMPDIVLGADIIYDPSCLPHLIRVLSILLNQNRAKCSILKEVPQGELSDYRDVEVNDAGEKTNQHAYELDGSYSRPDQSGNGTDPGGVKRHFCGSSNDETNKDTVAYIASVIRNIDTFNYFLELAAQANLKITDVTESLRPLNLLPYMHSYNRPSIRLFTAKCKY